VRGALLVADEDVVDGELSQGVVGGEDGAARVAEDLVHAFAGEGGPDDFGSGELGVLILSAMFVYLGELRLTVGAISDSKWRGSKCFQVDEVKLQRRRRSPVRRRAAHTFAGIV